MNLVAAVEFEIKKKFLRLLLVELNFDENLIEVGTLRTVAAKADYGDAISV